MDATMKTGTMKWIAAGALGALAIANGVMYHRVNTLETDLSSQRAAAQTEFQRLQETSSSKEAEFNKTFADVNAQMEESAKAAAAAAQRASIQAQKKAETLVSKMSEDVKAQQQAADERFTQEIGAVKTVTDEHTAKVNALDTSVGEVKTTVGTVQEQVAATKTQLDDTIAGLSSVKGDLGVQSGLIATNGKEIAALRELGERNYFEFSIKKNAPTKVGNVTLELKKADVKRNKYNVNVLADDKRVEKKDKTINEPVQMYVSGSRQPYEIVVNEVKKDTIVGYVSVPKVLRASR
ncbi:MAG: hypothetical protein WDO18_07985, partial [Acidobacteriota bacterium]